MNCIRTIAMIPARYASSRFPGKMLSLLGGKPVIVRTCEAAAEMGLFDKVYAVTDDERIRTAVTSAGIPCIMSRREHETGSDRIAEAVEGLDCDIVVNIQGDEPFTRKEVIEQVLRHDLHVLVFDRHALGGVDRFECLFCKFLCVHNVHLLEKVGLFR